MRNLELALSVSDMNRLICAGVDVSDASMRMIVSAKGDNHVREREKQAGKRDVLVYSLSDVLRHLPGSVWSGNDRYELRVEKECDGDWWVRYVGDVQGVWLLRKYDPVLIRAAYRMLLELIDRELV